MSLLFIFIALSLRKKVTPISHGGLSQKNHVQLMPSAGTYGYVPEVSYLFRFPRAIIPGGVEMDLDAVATATSTDGKDKTAWKNFNFQMGALSSALEHAIPEQMFVTGKGDRFIFP